MRRTLPPLLAALLLLAACGERNETAAFLAELLSPSNGGVAGSRQPELRWSRPIGAASYQVSCYADAKETILLERSGRIRDAAHRVSRLLDDGQVVHVRVEAFGLFGDSLGVGPPSRFRVRARPDWIPEFEVVTLKAGLSQGGYRLHNVMSFKTPPGEPRVFGLVLVNLAGEVLWWYQAPGGGRVSDARILANGNLLVSGAFGPVRGIGSAAELTWAGEIVWRAPPEAPIHHEVGPGPDGTVLYLTYTEKEIDGVLYKGDGVEIVEPSSNEVLWEWDIFDHLDPRTHPSPELNEEVEAGESLDWTHSNAAVWDEERGLIWVSVRHLDRIIGIGYPSGEITVTLGAGGLGGSDLMSHQHAPEMQPDGAILFYDNGNLRQPQYSRAVEIVFDQDAGSLEEVWEWRGVPDFYDFAVGDADRLQNGNTLITSGTHARLIEVTRSGEIAWDLRAEEEGRWLIYRADWVDPEQVPAEVRPFD